MASVILRFSKQKGNPATKIEAHHERTKQRKGLCPTAEDKKLWSKSIFCKILNKIKTSETAWLLRF